MLARLIERSVDAVLIPIDAGFGLRVMHDFSDKGLQKWNVHHASERISKGLSRSLLFVTGLELLHSMSFAMLLSQGHTTEVFPNAFSVSVAAVTGALYGAFAPEAHIGKPVRNLFIRERLRERFPKRFARPLPKED